MFDKNYMEQYLKLRDELLSHFEKVVKRGCSFPELIEVVCRGEEVLDTDSLDNEGCYWFYAKSIEQKNTFTIFSGKDLVTQVNKVTFIDHKGNKRSIEPDILDIQWLAKLVDEAV